MSPISKTLRDCREQIMKACFEILILHEVIRMLASMMKNEFAKALVRFERGVIDMWDDIEERLRMSLDDIRTVELGFREGTEGGNVILV